MDKLFQGFGKKGKKIPSLKSKSRLKTSSSSIFSFLYFQLAYKTRGIHGFLEEILQKNEKLVCKQNNKKNESKQLESFI